MVFLPSFAALGPYMKKLGPGFGQEMDRIPFISKDDPSRSREPRKIKKAKLMHFYLSAMLCRYVNSIIANDHNVILQEREATPQCRVVSVCATAQRCMWIESLLRHNVICRPTIADRSASAPGLARLIDILSAGGAGRRVPICVHLRLMRVAVRCCGLKWHPLAVWPRPSSMVADRRVPYGHCLMASARLDRLASLMRASINYRLMRATKPFSVLCFVVAETLSLTTPSYVFAQYTRQRCIAPH